MTIDANTADPAGQNPPPASGNGEPDKRSVSYESHLKLLEEKKRFQARAKELEEAEELRKQKELEQNGEYQKLIELKEQTLKQREDELKLKDSELSQIKKQNLENKKLAYLLDAIDGTVDQKFWNYIDIDDITVHPETGEIDKMSVAKAAEKLRAQYPEFIKSKKAGMPNEAPAGGLGKKISYAEWKALPLKEMKAWDRSQITD